jgi:hypothetical protein
MDQWQTTLISLARTLAIESGRTIAHLALLDGQRRSISWWQDAVLIGIRTELEERGISQKVAADMLGISVRTYQRRYVDQETVITAHRTLWMNIYMRLSEDTHVNVIKGWFPGRTPDDISSILRDMTSSGWLVRHQQHYRSAKRDKAWSTEMMSAYVTIRQMFGSSLEPKHLEEDTGVSKEIWSRVIARHTSSTTEAELVNVKDILPACMVMHRTQVRMLMNHIRDRFSDNALSSQVWSLPIPPKEDELNYTWFMEQVHTFRTQQTAFFKNFIHELTARYPSAKEEDFEHKFAWGSLAGTLQRDHDYDKVYPHESQ